MMIKSLSSEAYSVAMFWKFFCVLAVLGITSALSTTGTVHHQNGTTLESTASRSREKRSLFFPYNSAMGLIVAIAVPLIIPDRNIFMSYNFEANYNNPAQSNIFTEGFFNYIRGIAPPLNSPVISINRALKDDAEIVDAPQYDEDDSVTTTESTKQSSAEKVQRTTTERTPIFTRKKIYRSIEQHFERHGLNGKKCLLRAICESAETPLQENNGFLGDILHIVLSPSSSKDEHLPPEFYKAETLGAKGHCQKYRKHCEQDIFNLFSFVI